MDKLKTRRKLLDAFAVAFAGLFGLLRAERNFQIECVCGLAALTLGGVLRIGRLEWLVVVLTITVVLTAEALNAALERVVDLVSPEWHTLAKSSKDTAAAAVLIAALGAAVTGIIIFFPRLNRLAGG